AHIVGFRIILLVLLPTLEFSDPASRILTDPKVPERSRICGKDGCAAEVGVSYNGQPALAEGYCPRCTTPFSFAPKLSAGDLVADQYEIVGCLDRGGLGWVYLAKDTHLDDNYVALKGLINNNDAQAVALAVSERRFLTALDHPNIVRIFNFVTHPDPHSGELTGYIVGRTRPGATRNPSRRMAGISLRIIAPPTSVA
ncbi:MAG: serine/threonine protein kinase, partial [Pseudonocardiaceae bacterium]